MGLDPCHTKRSSEENRIKKRNNGIDGEFILHMYLNISIPEESGVYFHVFPLEWRYLSTYVV
jgi:hypothetical protein